MDSHDLELIALTSKLQLAWELLRAQRRPNPILHHLNMAQSRAGKGCSSTCVGFLIIFVLSRAEGAIVDRDFKALATVGLLSGL